MMLRAVSWLKDALTTKGVVPALGHYMLEPGRMGATDGRVCAVYPVEYDGPPALLPGAPLEKVLVSVGPDKDMKLTWPLPTQAVIKSGKLKCTFAVMGREHWPYDYDAMLETLNWHPWTDGLAEALRTVEPFIGTNAQRVWSTCVGFQRGALYATTNVAIARRTLVGKQYEDMDVLLPRWGYDFVMSRLDGLAEWAVSDEGAWFFRWENGAWARCAGVIGKFPGNAADIVAQRAVDPDSAFQLSAEWVEAYHQLAELTPDTGTITLTSTTMEGGDEMAAVVLEAGLGTVEPFTSKWTPQYLTPVVARAKYIDFTAFPKPAGFLSEDGLLSGVVLGRTI